MKSRIIVSFIFLTVVTSLMLYPVVAKGQAVKDGLVGYWTFDEKDTDIESITGLEYKPDQHTLGLWHFNEGSGGVVIDDSRHDISAQINGRARWNKKGGGSSFVSDAEGYVNYSGRRSDCQ